MRAARPRPSQPPDREVRHRAVAALIFGLLSMLATLGIGSDLHRAVYLLCFSVVIGPTACVLGFTARRKARTTGTAQPRGALGGIVLGAVAAVFAISVLTLYLTFPRQLTSYVNCVRQAQASGTSTQACETRLYKSLQPGSGG